MSIFYNKIEFQVEFNFSRESKTIKFHTYINLKIEIELQIESRFKKRPSDARRPIAKSSRSAMISAPNVIRERLREGG